MVMIDLRSPYRRFNLVRNPFGELTRFEQAELAVCGQLSDWLELLKSPRAALQFVGDCGFGKTTLLLAIQRALRRRSTFIILSRGPALPCRASDRC